MQIDIRHLAAEVEVVESRRLLSGVLTDTTTPTTYGAVGGNTTGDVTLATFKDSVPQSKFTTLSAAGAVSTSVSGISGGNIAGDFKDSSGVFHGYVYDGSTYNTITIQGATFTHVAGITGNVAFGTYTDSQGQKVGFTFNGTILTSLVAPNAVSTLVRGVSGNLIIGTYQDLNSNTHGFSFNGASYTLIDASGATSTILTGISGVTIVGYGVNGSGPQSFSLTGSTFTALTPTGAITSQALGISGNNIVGFYVDGSGNTHGYLYNGSTYTALDVSGATYTAAAAVSGNNVVGSYLDASGASHAFVYYGSTISTLDATGAAKTTATGISGTTIIGSYTGTGATTQSFSFQTPTTPAGFSTNVNWGGTVTGTPSVAVVLVSQSAAGSTWKVVGSAVYAQNGNYTPSVAVNDTTTGSSIQTNQSTFKVSDLADTTAADTLLATTGASSANAVLTTFTSVNPSAAASDFTVNVNWGGSVVGTPAPQVILVSRSATASNWEVVGNPVYGTAGNYSVSITVTENTGPSFISNKTAFSVTSAPVAVASFAGAYAAVTGNGTPVLASISQNGDQLTLNGSATASATLIVSPSNFIAGRGASYPPQLISNGGVVATSSNNSIKFMTGPLAGQTWTKLDLPVNYVNLQGAATQVIQNGASLTFVITATGQTSNGTWISPTQVSAFGQTGTVGSGKITWSGGNVWTENLVVNGSILLAGTSTNLSGAATIAASPNLFFTNYTNLGGAATHVIQTGSSLTFVVDATGETSDGHWISPTQVAATAWGQTGAVGETGSITWSGGNVWTVKPSLLPPVTTHYTNKSGAATHLIKDGAHLTFVVDASGETSNGYWISSTQVYAANWNLIGTVGSGTINWSSGQVWTGTATIAAPTSSSVTIFANLGGATTHVYQNGTSLTFVVDASGETSAGYWLSPTQVFATAWGQTGTVGATGSITWSGGNVWTVKSSPLPPVTTHYTNSNGAATHIVQDGTLLTFTVDATGETSSGYWISPTQVFATDWGQIGTVGSGRINWSGGQVWTGTVTIAAPVNSSVTTFTNLAGAATHLYQSGTWLTFVIDATGQNSPGYWISPTQFYATAFAQVGTVNGNSIHWSGGNIWSGNTTVSPGTYLTILTGAAGAVTRSYVQLTSPTAMVAVDGAMAGMTATRQDGTLLWSNGDIWNGLDLAGMNALFEMGTGYP